MVIFSIIIPTCSRNDLLSLCLDRLKPGEQTLAPDQYEVIVSDDGKDNEAKALVNEEYSWLKWVEGPKKGPAANRNNGAKQASGNWLIFFDDDCIPDITVLEAYRDAIEKDTTVRVFEGRISASRPRKRLDEEAPINETGGLLWSCNFAVSRSFFQGLGGFNEAFAYANMEDVDLRERIRKVADFKFVYAANVVHEWRRVESPARKFRNAYISFKVFKRLHPEITWYDTDKMIKYIGVSVLKHSIPEIIRQKGKGMAYLLHFHIFQFKILINSLQKHKF